MASLSQRETELRDERKTEGGKTISVNEELRVFVCLPDVVIYELRANSRLSNVLLTFILRHQ